MPRKGPTPRRRLSTDCPCGLRAAYDDCCGRFHAGVPAPTAELLMRSRYSAFVKLDEAYLLTTWHPLTRPATLALDPRLTWSGLTVTSVGASTVTFESTVTSESTVTFTARYVGGSMTETSLFTQEDGRWLYVGPTT